MSGRRPARLHAGWRHDRPLAGGHNWQCQAGAPLACMRGGGMTGGSGQRYERLLRLYPAACREQRGAEILATLQDAADSGRLRPAWREVSGLIDGALRVRTGVPTTPSRAGIWLSALRLAALLLLAHGTARRLAYAG